MRSTPLAGLRYHLLATRNTFVKVAFAGTLALAGTLSVSAQAVSAAGIPPPNPSRADLFLGYSYIHPVNSDINNVKYQPINPGAVGSVTVYFNRFLGVQAEGSFHPNGPNDCIYGAQGGFALRYPKNRFVPFAHVLGGGSKVGGPVFQPCNWGWGITSGIGFDYILPMWNNHLAIRPIQADFHYSHVDNGPLVAPANVVGGLSEIYAYKLSAGLVLRLGATSVPPPVQLGCTAQPVDVYPGDPVQVTAVTANLYPKRQPTYSWTATGGRVNGTGESASVATAGMTAGDYTVNGHVTQGLHPGMQADCTAGFRVHAYEPPTIACSASPTTITPGQSVAITAVGRSPQNRTLTYSYSASAGQVSGNGPTATLTTTGGQTGAITITCNVVDDLGQQASTTASVGINVPPPPPPPQPRSLCSVAFDRDRKRPVRVDNEAKGCLDDIALTLNRDTASRLVIVGHHGADEKPEAAAQRTLNVEQYLVQEKGVDPSRIELRTGDTAGRSVDNTLVPPGARFDAGSTTTFDGSSVRRQGQAYGKTRAGAPR